MAGNGAARGLMAHEILIVDDEADVREAIAELLGDEGYTPRQAGDGDSAIAAVQERLPTAVILDLWLMGNGTPGMDVLTWLQREHAGLPVLVISGHADIATAVEAVKAGAIDFIEKPFKLDRLLIQVERAIETAELRRENAELRLRAGGPVALVGRSQAIEQIQQAIDRAAPTGSRVLITGPPGSGKEVVARLIHQSSRRANHPFLVANCQAMDPTGMDTALFGTEQPVAPGQGRQIGLLERAHGGTLLLDEVGEMPLGTQRKIQRALQEQRFERVGGSRRVAVDVRVIATASRDLETEVAAGRFRSELYYRLNVVPITVPPLARRREDIPPLVAHFLKRSAASAGLPERSLADDAMAALQAYNWPGNVRQLRNVVEWLLIMTRGDPITANQLPPEIASDLPEQMQLDVTSRMMALPLREARELFERNYLLAQLQRFDGNISKTAHFVGMERTALHRKLRALGVQLGERSA